MQALPFHPPPCSPPPSTSSTSASPQHSFAALVTTHVGASANGSAPPPAPGARVQAFYGSLVHAATGAIATQPALPQLLQLLPLLSLHNLAKKVWCSNNNAMAAVAQGCSSAATIVDCVLDAVQLHCELEQHCVRARGCPRRHDELDAQQLHLPQNCRVAVRFSRPRPLQRRIVAPVGTFILQFSQRRLMNLAD
jgi:hypothetical protein